MVRGDVTFVLVRPFKQREIDDPDPGEIGARFELHVARHLEAKLPEDLVDDLWHISGEGEEISFLRSGSLNQFLSDRLNEFCDTCVKSRCGDLRHRETL